MKFFEMEFCVDGKPVYVTEPYDNLDAMLDEVTQERYTILEYICGRLDNTSFDKSKAPDSAENEEVVEAFDFWLSDLALRGFEGQEIEDYGGDICVACICREVKRIYTPKVSGSAMVPDYPNIVSTPC